MKILRYEVPVSYLSDFCNAYFSLGFVLLASWKNEAVFDSDRICFLITDEGREQVPLEDRIQVLNQKFGKYGR